MLTIGDAIALGTLITVIGGIVLKILSAKRNSGTNGTGSVKWISRDEHDALCKLKQENIDIRFDNIADDLQEIKADVKLLLQRGV
jgi:hypothetical protein